MLSQEFTKEKEDYFDSCSYSVYEKNQSKVSSKSKEHKKQKNSKEVENSNPINQIKIKLYEKSSIISTKKKKVFY